MFKVGDRVIDGYGKTGTVIEIDVDAKYPVMVDFDYITPVVITYTLDGRYLNKGDLGGIRKLTPLERALK